MALTSKTWGEIVKKKYLQSNDFKLLNSKVIAYLEAPVMTQQIRSDLISAWKAWELKLKQKNKTYKTSDRYVANGALEDIAQLASNPTIPRSYNEMIRQRDALNPEIRSEGNRNVKSASGSWKQAIFTQQQKYSCTCACATTFLSKLIDQPITEIAFKQRYNKINNSEHDFGKSGTTWEPICKTLKDFNADVVFHTTNNWVSLKTILNKASFDQPVLFGVEWDNGGSPGGGHAVMCIGKGPIPGWNGAEGLAGGFLIEDPWGKHETPGLLLSGEYHVYSQDGYWSKANAQPAWGCITGKKSIKEYVKYGSHLKVGRKIM
jgi:hypothetical protein